MSTEALLYLVPVVALPLAMALLSAVPFLRGRMFDLLMLAPVPGLVSALLAPRGTALEAPDLLLGMTMEITSEGALFLGFASALWIAAGVFARGHMKAVGRMPVFCAFWYLTLAGNLAVFVAGDAATFYFAFACVSLAAYPLVVHERTERAMRAGLVYIVLALIGETFLLLGMLLAVAGADSMMLADVREALGGQRPDHAAIAFLVAGFGIKAGLVPLHVWLPLAHPAAPTPASAVLSGAIVKAGIFGLIQFLPAGSDPGAWGPILVATGIAGAWYGILAGLTQSNPKTVLAYSTVSQMGIVIAVIGASLQPGGGPLALAAASLYALHHGLAKGALFLGVGVAQSAGSRAAPLVMAALAVIALSVAGLPLTGGALAKLAIKGPLGGGLPELLVTASAAGTGLLLLHFLFALRAAHPPMSTTGPSAMLAIPFAVTGAAAIVAPWLLFESWSGQQLSYWLVPANLWAALWPLLVAAALAALVLVAGRPRLPSVPEGDLVAPAGLLIGALARWWKARAARWSRPLPPIRRPVLGAISTALARLEARLSDWAVAGTLFGLAVLAMIAANAL